MTDKKDDPTDLIPDPDSYVGKFLAEFKDVEDSVVGLTDRQREVFKLTLRGLTQRAIAEVLNISQPAVAKHWKAVKEKFAEIGASVNQDQVVGESVSLYSEVEQQAWALFYTAKTAGKGAEANRALTTIMTARDKQLQLLMDLGLLRRAAIEHEHKVTASPLVQAWEQGDPQKKMEISSSVIETQLDELEDPEPPKDIIDAEFEDTDGNNST